MSRQKGFLSDGNWLNRLGRPAFSILLLPGFGILVFLVLYLLAAALYPGGSAADPLHPGFDFWNNYLCDLLDEYALNGELNTARYYARASLFALCSGILFLWFYLPKLFDKKTVTHYIMWASGILALLIIFFMATHNHDLIVRLAGVFGIAAMVSCATALIQAGFRKLGILGLCCLIIFLINYFIYESGIYIRALPLIQKVTFVLCLTWFLSLNNSLYVKIKEEVKK